MTTPKEALERARTAINAIVLSTHSVSFKADLDAIDSALASLQREDAVERVARIIDPYAWTDLDDMTPTERFIREKRLPKMREEARTKARAILATGLVPDEAAIRADEREKCARVADAHSVGNGDEFDDADMGGAIVARQIAAAIRSGGGE